MVSISFSVLLPLGFTGQVNSWFSVAKISWTLHVGNYMLMKKIWRKWKSMVKYLEKTSWDYRQLVEGRVMGFSHVVRLFSSITTSVCRLTALCFPEWVNKLTTEKQSIGSSEWYLVVPFTLLAQCTHCFIGLFLTQCVFLRKYKRKINVQGSWMHFYEPYIMSR